VLPERERVANRSQCERARELERITVVTRVPVHEAETRPTAWALSRPAMASMRVSDIGMEAVIPVVVATAPSTTSRRSAT
jgi:hypothetical protein